MRSEYEKQVRHDLRQEKWQKSSLFRKIVLISLAVLLWISSGYFCVLGVVDAFTTKKVPEFDPNEKQPISLSNPNWSEDIFKNERWLEYDHQIYYGTEHLHRSVTEESAEKISVYADFFYHYFTDLMTGKYEGFASYYDATFQDAPQEFTMQKLFDIYVFEVSDDLSVAEDGVEVRDFVVKYRILENDGTFRNDLQSAALNNEYYRLSTDESGNVKIHEILPIVPMVNSEVSWPRGILFSAILLILLAIPVVLWVSLSKRRKKVKQ